MPEQAAGLRADARLCRLATAMMAEAYGGHAADQLGRAHVDLLNAEEARVRELIAAGTWPKRWTGDEPTADVPLDGVFSHGSVQRLLFTDQPDLTPAK
ncbi:hypothetical protein [Methylobacterium mesophilicum]|uniref:hypothetical protein n=1 Tax=Methylobacterium mesophilicum TaxID=39956 RepID=UPI002F355504